MLKKSLQKFVQPYDASQYAVNPKILAWGIKEIRITVFHFKHSIDLVKGNFDYLLLGQLLLHVEEVVEQLNNIFDRVGKSSHPFWHLHAFRRFVRNGVDKQFCCFEYVLRVLWLIEDVECLIIVFYIPIDFLIHEGHTNLKIW